MEQALTWLTMTWNSGAVQIKIVYMCVVSLRLHFYRLFESTPSGYASLKFYNVSEASSKAFSMM